MKDEEIIDLYFKRDENAIKETDSKYGNYCYVVSNNILNNPEDAKECVNDTFLTAWNKIPPERPYILSAFLAKITRNISLTRYRLMNAQKRSNDQVSMSIDELAYCIGKNNTEEEVDADILKDSINDFLALENENDRKIFVMRYFYFYSIEEIAEYYGFGLSRVKMSLKRTRDKLKTYLKKEGYTL